MVKFFDRFKTPKANVSLTIPQSTIELGATLKGTVFVSSNEEFDTTEIRVELRCIERRRRERWVYNKRLRRNVRRVYWDQATLHSADPQAHDKLHLVPGFRRQFPVEVEIPAGGRESFDGVDANVTWFAKAVIAVDDRPDVTSETLELQVIRSTGKPAVTKATMVACKYCETMMPETASSCPICGAPRKSETD